MEAELKLKIAAADEGFAASGQINDF